MIKKYYLLSPGPTPVPENVLAAAAEPIIHHRTPEFSGIFMEVSEGLKYVFGTEDRGGCFRPHFIRFRSHGNSSHQYPESRR